MGSDRMKLSTWSIHKTEVFIFQYRLEYPHGTTWVTLLSVHLNKQYPETALLVEVMTQSY